MISLRNLWLIAFSMMTVIARADDWLDRMDESLTFATEDGGIRVRASGLFDLEGYHFSGDPTGLIFTEDRNLFNPRLSLYLDGQVGSHLYFFLQARADRGFDPGESASDARLDEYAVRWTPWDDGRFNLQVGKFGTVVGNWVARHDSWSNPFINAPLIYENITAIYDSEVPDSRSTFLEGLVDIKYDYNPVIWGPSYATGVAVSGALGEFDYAFEAKNVPLSSRPKSWGISDVDLDHPTVSGRLGWRPDAAWNLGVSASEGAYLLDRVEDLLPRGTSMNDFKERVLGQDISFAWHHWQLWAECYEAQFQVPNVGNANTLGYYVEAKYRFTPEFFGALRWNQQLYDTVPNADGVQQKWGNDLWRIDAAFGWRFSAHTQLKLQYSVQREEQRGGPRDQMIATQLTVRF